MSFTREISELLKKQARLFKIFTLLGPRQSGKTTLLRTLFLNYIYVSLESPDVLERMISDFRSFFRDIGF